MDLTKSILREVREAVGLTATTTDFDTELIMHINAAIGELNQNGVGNFLIVKDEEARWVDLQDILQIEGNKYFQLVPLFVSLSTKLVFDPPPPSSVEFQANSANKLLWRLKLAYEEPYFVTTEGGEY